MKQDLSLQDLARKVQFVSDNKHDFVVPANNIRFDIDEHGIRFSDEYKAKFDGLVTPHAFNQVTTDVGIPATYARKLNESKNHELLQTNVNTLVSQQDKNRMLRLVENDMRGYLSDSFSTDYDNDTILKALLPVLHDMGDSIEVRSCSLTDTKMYLKVISKKLTGDVKVSDPVSGGLSIVNSEVGMSFYSENEFIERLVCLNGMTRPNNISSFRKMHRGSRKNVGMIQRDTLYATRQAIALQIRDSVTAALSPARFQQTLEDMRATTERKISGKPEEAIRELGKQVGFTQTEGDEIFKHLIEGGDLSQWGLVNAVTRYSQYKNVNYDRASDLEIIGGKVLELNPRQWKVVSEAA